MFDPANPLNLPVGHPLLDPKLSPDTLRAYPALAKEMIDLLGPFGSWSSEGSRIH